MEVVQQIVVTIQALVICLVAVIKSLLPNGVLPRKSVSGKIVLITGSGNGIGRIMSREFAKLGAKVVLWDINEKWNAETKKQVEAAGGKAYAYTVDISEYRNIYEAADRVKAEVGNVDILINNAGIVTGKKLLDSPDDAIARTIAVNTSALLYTTKAFLPYMLEHNDGHIVTTASIVGKVGASGVVDYCTSKFGAVGFHEALSAELDASNKTGIKTTVICPYAINTGMFAGIPDIAPGLLPILDPEYVVECVMEGILTERNFVSMPKFCYAMIVFAAILPQKVCLMFARNLGFDKAMNHFTGRKPVA